MRYQLPPPPLAVLRPHYLRQLLPPQVVLLRHHCRPVPPALPHCHRRVRLRPRKALRLRSVRLALPQVHLLRVCRLVLHLALPRLVVLALRAVLLKAQVRLSRLRLLSHGLRHLPLQEVLLLQFLQALSWFPLPPFGGGDKLIKTIWFSQIPMMVMV